MTVPSYRFFIDPLLRYLEKHCSPVRASDAHDAVADALVLTSQDRDVEVPSGMKTYKNRTSWAFNTLKNIGLADSPEAGLWELTSEGRALCDANDELSPEQLRQLIGRVQRSPKSRQNESAAEASVLVSRSMSLAAGNKKAYRLTPRPLASGGQADVYEALRKADNKLLILKRAKNFMAAKRMRREIQVQSSLRHVNVMPILDWDVEGFAWYVMPKGIRAMSEITPPLEPKLLCNIFRSVAAALEHSHSAGYPHRDVKPHNIIELRDGEEKGRWVLADWGLTRRALGETTAALTKSGALGTEGYAPPESYQDAHEFGAPGDVYSLGQVVAWATGMNPIPNVSPRVAAPWTQLINAMTQQSPEERPQTISDVLNLFEEIESAISGAAP
jgi:Protein kinase domain/Mrr N-terminal domain